MIRREYQSFADKRETWPRTILPAIFGLGVEGARNSDFKRWLRSNGLPDHATNQRPVDLLWRLHYVIKDGLIYEHDSRQADEIYTVAETLQSGMADCEDGAALVIAAATLWGLPALLVTAGDWDDPYRHVYPLVAASANDWREMDVKPNARGVEWGERSENYPVRRVWGWRMHGNAVELFEITPEMAG